MRYLVYEYGCQAPVAGEEVALEQMRRRVEFWNALFAIEQDHIVRTRELLAVLDVDNQITTIGSEISEVASDVKAKARSAAPEVQQLRSRLKLLKASMKEMISQARQLRRELVNERRAALSALDQQRKAAVKVARANAGLYWCNADEVIAFYEAARIRAMKAGTSVGSRQWRGNGIVSVKYQQGLSPSSLPGDTRFQIDPVDPLAWSDPRRHVRRHLCRTMARIRVGSTETRHPIWLELPMIMHRPLPEDALIRNVRIKRFRIGTEYRYKLLITVREQTPKTRTRRQGPASNGAISLGLRMTGKGIRVGYWAGHTGEHGELLLPTTIISQFDKVDEIRSRLDRNWNDTRNEIAAWLGNASVPDWLRDATHDLPQWMDYHRPLSLVEVWAGRRFTADETPFTRLLEWRRRHVHLYAWASHLRDQVQVRRREHYRITALDLARRFDHLFIVTCATPVAVKPSHGQTTVDDFARMRAVAAPGILRRTLIQTCEREGADVRVMPAVGLEKPCPACGALRSLADHEPAVFIRCLVCSETFDWEHWKAAAVLESGLKLLP